MRVAIWQTALERQEVHRILLFAWGIFAVVGCGWHAIINESLMLRLLLGVDGRAEFIPQR